MLRFSAIEEGTIITLKNNTLENTGNYLGEGFLKASSVNGVVFEFVGNTYDGEPIDRDSYGILIEE